jgi:SnoaL-like domain
MIEAAGGLAMAEDTLAQRIEQVIRTYIRACNDGDAQAIATCFCPDAVHYLPAAPKRSGAATIGDFFAKRVQELGLCWTVDQVLVDVERRAAALEWTRFDSDARVVRGVDWFVFEPRRFEFAKSDRISPYHPVRIWFARKCRISTMPGGDIRRTHRPASGRGSTAT